MDAYKKGFVKLGGFKEGRLSISYLPSGMQKKIENGEIAVLGKNENGSIIFDADEYTPKFMPGTQWRIKSHDATEHGTKLLEKYIGHRFSYPKSLYAVRDSLSFYLANKKNALVVDFFAGSGTTLHAVNLLNAEDGGKRRCIIITNNEVSDEEAKKLSKQGFYPGDKEWEKLGIAHYVTWPRTVCSIKGIDVNGNKLKGNYIGTEIPLADGFKTNAVFLKLGFLNHNSVALGRQFKELLPVLWMKAGAFNACPVFETEKLPDMMILPENKFAVLLDEKMYMEFIMELDKYPEIKTVYFVTDSEAGYRDMISCMEDKNTYQLYRDYLDNFRINSVRR